MQSVNNMLRRLFYSAVAIGCFFGVGHLCAEEAVDVERKSSAAIKTFIKNYRSGCFTYISNGHFFHLPQETEFGIWVTASTKETLQSGRALAVMFIEDYFCELQRNKDTSKWYQTLCAEESRWYSGKLSLKNIGARIAFWDESVERPKAPYLSEIDFYENKFRYFEADPQTQALKLVLEETYEQAMANLEKDRESKIESSKNLK